MLNENSFTRNGHTHLDKLTPPLWFCFIMKVCKCHSLRGSKLLRSEFGGKCLPQLFPWKCYRNPRISSMLDGNGPMGAKMAFVPRDDYRRNFWHCNSSTSGRLVRCVFFYFFIRFRTYQFSLISRVAAYFPRHQEWYRWLLLYSKRKPSSLLTAFIRILHMFPKVQGL